LERVLAIDGALNHSGWAILEDTGKGKDEIIAKQYGIIKPKATMSLGFKLFYIRTELNSLFNKYKPTIIVFEDTYAGKNAKTNARLNNAKGVFYVTAYELLKGNEPAYVSSVEARRCLGFKNNKNEPYEFFKKMYGLKESFEKANDITDAMTVGFWYLYDKNGDCASNKKEKKKKSTKQRSTKKKR